MNNSEQTFPIKQLKPCPFCGKPVSAIQVEMINESGNLRTIGLDVECYSCAIEIKIDTKYKREDAIDRWNTRTESEGEKKACVPWYLVDFVLCKDCKFNEIPGKANVLCVKGMSITNPYGYCSEGKRRTNE